MKPKIMELLAALTALDEKECICDGYRGTFLPLFKTIAPEDLERIEQNIKKPESFDFSQNGDKSLIRKENFPCILAKDLVWVIVKTFTQKS